MDTNKDKVMNLIEILMAIDDKQSNPSKPRWARAFLKEVGVNPNIIDAIITSMDSRGNFVNIDNQPVTLTYTVN